MKKSQGFTLIEVMVVVVILGILAAIIVPNVIGKDDKARVEATRTSLKAVGNALEMYKLDNHKYPTTEEGLEALIKRPASAKSWNPQGYLKGGMPKDSWGNELQYMSPGPAGRPYELYSLGADGVEGGEGNDADIVAE